MDMFRVYLAVNTIPPARTGESGSVNKKRDFVAH